MSTNLGSTRNGAADPFYVFKDELASKVSAVNQKYAKWRAICDAPDAPAAKELPALTAQIEGAVAAADKSLKFLEDTIVMVEANRAKFAHIDAAEVASRRAFVAATRKELQSVSSDISSDVAKARVRREERKLMMPTTKSTAASSPSADDSNGRFIADETQRQKQIMQSQDQSVDGLLTSVQGLNHVAVQIRHEVKDQNKMLDDLNQDVGEAQERMNFVMDKMSKMLKTKDRCQLGLILFLALVLVAMIFLVIYT